MHSSELPEYELKQWFSASLSGSKRKDQNISMAQKSSAWALERAERASGTRVCLCKGDGNLELLTASSAECAVCVGGGIRVIICVWSQASWIHGRFIHLCATVWFRKLCIHMYYWEVNTVNLEKMQGNKVIQLNGLHISHDTFALRES